MNNIRGALIAIATLSMSQPLLADVKLGVDAWQQGDYTKAVTEWLPLAEAGDPDAQFNMGQAYKLGRGVSSDLNAAIQWYRKASAQGHMRAEDNLGLCLFQKGERATAMPYLERAAGRGDTRAQYIYATALFNGDLVEKDWVRAYALMSRASAAGLSQANVSLQQMDKYISDEQRGQGKALATSMGQEKSAPSASTAASAGNVLSALRPAPSPIRTAEVAPSIPPAQAQTQRLTPSKRNPVPQTSPSSAAGAWRVQLGAFSEGGRARTMWNKLRGKVRALASYQPYFVTAGGITRLQAGPLNSSADAARLCTQIKSAGADCMPRKN